MAESFPWRHFWCRRENTFFINGPRLSGRPEAEHGNILNPNLSTFDQLQAIPCLALLGEPGMGKSWGLSADVDAYIQQSPDTAMIRLDLLSFCSEDRLYRALFEDDVFARWVESDSDLHLYIDSLDECILRIDSVAAVLADEIPKYPLKQLKLRFACRTAPWPTLLEKALKNGFGEEHFAAAELVPLRRVRGAALQAIYLGEKYDDAMWSYLEHPGRELYHGSYNSFLTYSVLPKVNADNFPAALRWCEKQPPGELGPIPELEAGIYALAIEHIDADGLAELLAKAVFERARSFRSVPRKDRSKDFAETMVTDIARRRRFLDAFLPLLNRENANLMVYPLSLLLLADLDWLIDRVVSRTSPAPAEPEAHLICRLACSWEPDGSLILSSSSMKRHGTKPIVLSNDFLIEMQEDDQDFKPVALTYLISMLEAHRD